MLEQSTTTTRSIDSAIEEKTIDLCLRKGMIEGIKYYWEQKNQQTGIRHSLRLAKEDVETLLRTRGLRDAVRQPKNKAWLVMVGIILLSIAVGIYFYSRAHVHP
ncbi:MAG TPA: hypothetical protein VFS25_07135 [Chitinophaga sp.]|uniref:hypothetical protein n=1 Tax=Chitinophaga sp. TaxID=1869181 RepID=UPI002DB9F3FE|nr:hypothetical protein [Chitinophaga sp.]HEU4552588.1 hypothetical protein [Chitinophaga sp.]